MKIDNRIKEVLWTEKEIVTKIKEKSVVINEYYKGKEAPIFLGVLKGCTLFFSHLLTSINMDINVQFMSVSRTKGTVISDVLLINWDMGIDVTGKDILIVEDVIDTGVTLSELKRMLFKRGAREVKTITLVDKPKNRKIDFQADWVVFELNTKEWLVGWGFDLDEKMRSLPYVGFLKDEYKG